MEAQGERMYCSYSFTTSAYDGGEWSASRPGRVLAPGKGLTVPIVQEAGRAPEPVWSQRLEEKSFPSAGDRTSIVQSVARHYNDWATPKAAALNQNMYCGKKSGSNSATHIDRK
jgi:hypothetical protein